MKRYIHLLILCALPFFIQAQDTTIVQTLTYDSSGRNYMFQFPPDNGTSYEKILMEYNMRCKGAQVSTGTQPNLGCGEWDYSCNTYIVDSTYTDSLRTTHPSHIISGFSGDEFNFTYNPTNTYIQYDQQMATYNNVISETSVSVGSGTELLDHPFGTSREISRTQYLWTATELITADLAAGDISSLRFDVDDAPSEAQFLRIKMKHTDQDELDVTSPELDGFEEVYFLNTQLNAGENEFLFYDNFTWDGVSNILTELSFSNPQTGSNDLVLGETLGSIAGLVSSGQNYNLEFTGSEYLELPTNDFENISNEITISFWSYGSADQLPQATTIFEGVDDQNRRQANVHLPWSNSRVYWDCGNDGNYDRIDKAANLEDFAGKWNHWSFTKNVISGDMKIYLNGVLWHSGSGKTKPMDLTKFTLGSSDNQGRFYYGNIDEFQIWNAELSETEIASWMHRTIDGSHPKYNNLIAYYKMNEGNNLTTENSAPGGGAAQINGQANWNSTKGEALFTNYIATDQRPNITFVQGEYEMTVNTLPVIDTLVNNQNAITTYEVIGTDLAIQNVEYVWQGGHEYLYNTAGMVLDSFAIIPDGTINIGELIYYRKFPSQFEIMSFVTPYGINLNLGPQGKTWTFDVTDFTPILKDRKRMFLALGGQNQEEMDIRFIFIEGTPPAKVRNIQQIWRSGSSYGYTAIQNDDILEPREILLDAQGEYFKIRTRVTGHGQEGEFIPRNHWINIDGGDPEFEWQVWKECADNPVYPQGGTWIYDRAGWCPGAPTDLQEWNITNLVTPGQSVNVDYNVTSGSGNSRYITSHQLVTYGSANFSLDAAITEIKRPTKQVEQGRVNPVCNDPVVVLRNTGAINLTNATITYRVAGHNAETYEWNGNLGFMESEEVTLPVSDLSFWGGNGENRFIATVSNPNGGTDEYTPNSSLSTSYTLPKLVNSEEVIITLSTNNLAGQNTYRLKDASGNILLEKSGFANNTTYQDTVQIEDGCYTLELDDTGDNGLQFWNQPSQGAGTFYIRDLFTVLKVFEPDFGKSIRYSFMKGEITNIETPELDHIFEVFPNPSSGTFNVLLDLPELQDLQLYLYDMTGRAVKTMRLDRFVNGTVKLDLSNEADGLYHCTIVSKDWTESRKILKLRQ